MCSTQQFLRAMDFIWVKNQQSLAHNFKHTFFMRIYCLWHARMEHFWKRAFGTAVMPLSDPSISPGECFLMFFLPPRPIKDTEAVYRRPGSVFKVPGSLGRTCRAIFRFNTTPWILFRPHFTAPTAHSVRARWSWPKLKCEIYPLCFLFSCIYCTQRHDSV